MTWVVISGGWLLARVGETKRGKANSFCQQG